jgi:hypothetical protein
MKQPNFPPEDELRKWWQREQEFMETPFGRAWYASRHEAERLWREHQHYQKLILDYSERNITQPIIPTGDKPQSSSVPFSNNLERTLLRTNLTAKVLYRKNVTVEYLLLELTDDEDAVAVMKACDVDIWKLRFELYDCIKEYKKAENQIEPQSAVAFRRVLQRAAIHVQSSGRKEVTGANVLIAIFAERESCAVSCLQKRGMTRYDAVNFVTHGIKKRPMAK